MTDRGWTLPELVRSARAELVQWGPGPFGALSTDSRKTGPGEVFLALSGPNFDGHDFLAVALERGATAAIVACDRPAPRPDVAWLRVRDGLRSLGDLAAARRRSLAARVVGVTGSNGKTTTKEMVASVLAASGKKVAKTHGTENNLVGLPQTILRLSGDEAFAVLELGMNHPGEIWRLAEIADPDVGVITNVGPAHLEGLGTIANVAAAKEELALAMRSTATLVLPAADPWLGPVADRFSGSKILVGEGGVVRALRVEALPGGQRVELQIDGRRASAVLACVGAHNVTTALLAAAAGLALGLEAETIARGLERFEPPPMRLEVVALTGGVRLLNDAYNANPASMTAALASLAAEAASRRIAVLGEMWELGARAAEFHREVGRAAAEAGVDLLLAVGRFRSEIGSAAVAAGLPAARVRELEGTEEAALVLRAYLREGDVVLVKGSRGARMEEIVQTLRDGR